MNERECGSDSRCIVCRCEDVTLKQIKECIEDGFTTIDAIKTATRAGMGPCQGRTCRDLVAREISNAFGVPLDDVILPAFRPPAKSIPIFVLADAFLKERKIAHDVNYRRQAPK